MDWHDWKVFVLLAVLGAAIYYVGFRGDARRRPHFDVANTPTVSYTPIGVPGLK